MEQEETSTEQAADAVVAWVDSWPVESSEAEDGTSDHVVIITKAPWTEKRQLMDADGDEVEHIKATYNVPMPWSMWLAGPETFKEHTRTRLRRQTYNEVLYPVLAGDDED